MTPSRHPQDDTFAGQESPSSPEDPDPFTSVFTTAQAARVQDVWFGGKDNFLVDRVSAAKVASTAGWLPAGIKAGRLFVLHAVRAAVDNGLDQILDIGTGLPLQPYLHTLAWQQNAKVQVVYVPDPTSATIVRAILARHDGTSVLDSGLATPRDLLAQADLVLDLTRPVIVVMDGVLDQVPDAHGPADLVGELGAGLAPGSRLIVTHVTADQVLLGDRHAATVEAIAVYNAAVVPPLVPRTAAEIEPLLSGLEFEAPGIAALGRSGAQATRDEERLPMLAAVGVVPPARLEGRP